MVESWASSAAIRRSMQANRPRNTAPELALRSALHHAGLRFRKHLRPVPGLRCEPDVVFTRAHLAIFLDGCWWHSCPQHGQVPKTHQEFWAPKLAKTRERDKKNTAALTKAGWTVLRIWEHESIESAVDLIQDQLQTMNIASLRKSESKGTVRLTHSKTVRTPG